MQWWIILALVAFVGIASGQNETSPNPPERNHARPNECCVIPRGLAPSTMKTAFKKCFEKYPKAKTSKPPSGTEGSSFQEVKNARACVAECVFSEEGLLTAGKALNKTAIIEYFRSSPTDEDLSTARSSAVETCLGMPQAEQDPSLECRSGADDLHKCVNRQVFLHCPRKMWSSTPQCEELKVRITADKSVPVFFRGPKRGTKELNPRTTD